MIVENIVAALVAEDFYIATKKEIPYGLQIKLGCGAVVNVYSSGKVMVQGKLIPACAEESMPLLVKALPPLTMWMLPLAKTEPYATLIRDKQLLLRTAS